MQDAEFSDKQDAAFREMKDADRIADDELREFMSRQSAAGVAPEHDREHYESDNWDSGKEPVEKEG